MSKVEIKEISPVEKETDENTHELHIEWKIDDIFSVADVKKKEFHYFSPYFCFENHLWYFTLLQDSAHFSEWLILLAHSQDRREYSVEYKCGLKKLDGSVELLLSGILKGHRKWSKFCPFIKLSEILERRSELAPSNVLTITCTLRTEIPYSTSPGQAVLDKPKLKKLIRDDSTIDQSDDDDDDDDDDDSDDYEEGDSTSDQSVDEDSDDYEEDDEIKVFYLPCKPADDDGEDNDDYEGDDSKIPIYFLPHNPNDGGNEDKDDYEGIVKDLDVKEKLVTYQVMITTKSYVISNASNHLPITEYSGGEKLKMYGCALEVFPNGLGEQNKGYVSVLLSGILPYFQVTMIVSLVDASDSQRFSQTFSTSELEFPPLYIDKYISHETLLSDPGDLLPNDILTLKFEVWLTGYRSKSVQNIAQSTFVRFRKPSSTVFELCLDCPGVKRLSEESNVFSAMLDTPMNEKRTKMMPFFDGKSFPTLVFVSDLLLGVAILDCKSIELVLNMYIFADMFDIPFVSDTCTCFLKLYLSLHSEVELLETVDGSFEDENLKELLKNHIRMICLTNFSEEIDKTDINVVSMKQPIQNCLWVYKELHKDTRIIFFNRNVETTYNLTNEEYNFYE